MVDGIIDMKRGRKDLALELNALVEKLERIIARCWV